MPLTLALGMVVAAMTSGCVHPPVVDRQTEEYAVYSGLINSFQSQPGVDLLLVANQTTSKVLQDRELDEKEFIKYDLPDATAKETLDDYKLSDSQPLNIANRFAVNRKYILINNQEALREQRYASQVAGEVSKLKRSYHHVVACGIQQKNERGVGLCLGILWRGLWWGWLLFAS